MKERNESDYEKITKSIEKHGFSFPFFVWKKDETNYVLDGHGRLEALKQLKQKGVEIPNLPVSYISCKSEKEAKDLLLRLNSQYGRMSKKSVVDFIGKDFDLDIKDFALPAFQLDLTNPFESVQNYYQSQPIQESENYTRAEAPNPVIERPLENLEQMDIDAISEEDDEFSILTENLTHNAIDDTDIVDISDKYETQYKIEIDVDNENEQEKLFNELLERGYECRVLTL